MPMNDGALEKLGARLLQLGRKPLSFEEEYPLKQQLEKYLKKSAEATPSHNATLMEYLFQMALATVDGDLWVWNGWVQNLWHRILTAEYEYPELTLIALDQFGSIVFEGMHDSILIYDLWQAVLSQDKRVRMRTLQEISNWTTRGIRKPEASAVTDFVNVKAVLRAFVDEKDQDVIREFYRCLDNIPTYLWDELQLEDRATTFESKVLAALVKGDPGHEYFHSKEVLERKQEFARIVQEFCKGHQRRIATFGSFYL